MIGLHLLFGLLKPLSLMDILFPSFYSWKYTSLVTVDFYDFFSTWATALLSPVNTSALGCGVLGVISGEDEKN
jgi:hypothetical protein